MHGLFEELEGRIRKSNRRAAYVERAWAALAAWAERNGVPAAIPVPAEAACAS